MSEYCCRCKEEINKIKREKLLELSSSLSKENAPKWRKDMNSISIPTELMDDNCHYHKCLLVYVISLDEYEFGYYYDPKTKEVIGHRDGFKDDYQIYGYTFW
tara:strand:+ start:1913 stop:2218 length:306 start_codon:yes stop_codon:yes gene_type:complete